jgi:tetratricopeptide (TPR) repeat protein/Ni/Co efflux regulator RcnB
VTIGKTKIAISVLLTLSFVVSPSSMFVDSVLAQTRSQFPKSNRGVASSVAQPKRIQTPAQVQRESQYRQQNRRRPQQQFNHHSFYPSRSVYGAGHRYSPGHFRGNYIPISPYGYGYGSGFGGPIVGVPVYGNSFGYGYVNPQFRTYNPAFATYGTYLSTGVGSAGVLGSDAVGSSVAAQAMERLRNQQQVGPEATVNAAQEAEILRLQIELERAKQQLANQNQAQQKPQQTMKPVVVPPPPQPQATNSEVIDQLGLAAIIETNDLASSSHLKAERAFRSGDYGQAARFVGLSRSLDESNGKLTLFAAQAHFANGEYREAAAALKKAHSILEPNQLGYVVQNYKLFYGQNDFVTQMQQLSNHLNSSPEDARAWLLRGFQYGALGYPEAARKDLTRAKDLGANADLVETLLSTYSVEVELDQ